MLKRLAEYLRAKPRKGAMIVVTLLVVLILVVAGNLFQLLNLGSYFEPPYPSEETPLSMVADGIMWDNPIQMATASWNTTKLYWMFKESYFATGLLANDSQQAELSSGTPTTITRTLGGGYDGSSWINMTIFDSTGDGSPAGGGYILFTGPPLQSDIVYTIALAFIADGFALSEYSYAIHDGKFYSWRSSTEDTVMPWWYPW